MSDSDSEYSDTLTINTAVNDLTDEINDLNQWRTAIIQRLDLMDGRIDELQIRADSLATDSNTIRGHIHLLEHRRGLEPGAGGGNRRKRTRGKLRARSRRKKGGQVKPIDLAKAKKQLRDEFNLKYMNINSKFADLNNSVHELRIRIARGGRRKKRTRKRRKSRRRKRRKSRRRRKR